MFKKIRDFFLPRKRFHNPIDISEKYDILSIDEGGEPQPRLPGSKQFNYRGRYLATASLRKSMAGQ
jgi:hypothetical protein